MLITQSGKFLFNRETNNGKSMGPFTHIVSIVCPGDNSIKPISYDHCIVKINDIDKPTTNLEIPSFNTCIGIINYIVQSYHTRRINNNPFNMLIHCDAGISRSSAITLGALWWISASLCEDFNKVETSRIREYIHNRKQICASLLSTEYDVCLREYIDNKDTVTVLPNQAILKHIRNWLAGFPW